MSRCLAKPEEVSSDCKLVELSTTSVSDARIPERKSLDTSLHQKIATITFTVKNTGALDGTEVSFSMI